MDFRCILQSSPLAVGRTQNADIIESPLAIHNWIQIPEGAMVIIIEIIVTSRTEQYYCQKYFLQIMNS